MAAAALVAAIACDKTPEPWYTLTEAPIFLCATESGAPTKALMTESTFVTGGNQIQIYDFYTSGSVSGLYISDQVEADGTGADVWPFVNKRYNWTSDGKHKFFGWLATDANSTLTAASLFGSDFAPAINADADITTTVKAFDTANQVLNIPTTVMNAQTPQFDFMYSNVHVRDLDNNPDFASPVPLEFNHLFTAFSVAAKNSSESDVVVKSIAVEGLKNKKSATITYKNVADKAYPTVTYSEGENDNVNVPEFTFTPNVKLTSSLTDMSTPATSERDYFLMWPKSADNPGDASDDVILKVTYNTGDGSDDITVDVKVPGAWIAGERNNLNLEFTDKQVRLECVVEPWIVQTEEIDYAQQSVTVSKKMSWTGVQDVNYETGEVILKSDGNAVATCTFRIDTPVGATWTASLILANEDGSVDAFSWVDDTKYGIVGTGTDSEIKLKVNKFAPIAPQHVCILRITVQTSDMRTIVVNDLAPDTYLDENGVEHATNGYTEFQIIQNIITG